MRWEHDRQESARDHRGLLVHEIGRLLRAYAGTLGRGQEGPLHQTREGILRHPQDESPRHRDRAWPFPYHSGKGRARGRRHRLLGRNARDGQEELRGGGGGMRPPQDGRAALGIRGRLLRPGRVQKGHVEPPRSGGGVQGMAQGPEAERKDDIVRCQLVAALLRRGVQEPPGCEDCRDQREAGGRPPQTG